MASTLDTLFPTPSLSPSRISPVVWPGSAPESVEALREVLKDNHVKWHIFFNDDRFHNHSAHHALAIWALGAAGPIIKAAYEVDAKTQRPLYKSPGEITHENWMKHLGDETYYDAYLRFFTDVVQKQGTAASLQHYLFSHQANVGAQGNDEEHPNMLNRLHSGLLHPLIHTGYGVEFGLPGMVVEGLAQTAVHKTNIDGLIPASSFETGVSEAIDNVMSRFSSILALNPLNATPVVPSGVHAFTVIARITKDTQFDGLEPEKKLKHTLTKHGEAIRDYASQWSIDTTDPKGIEAKIEELAWTIVLLYGVSGWSEDKDFYADFLLMHLVTSSLFLSSMVAYLTPASQVLLLRTYFSTVLGWWITRGRPGFNIHSFYTHHDEHSDLAYPIPPGAKPTPAKGTLPDPSSPYAITPNPWLPILESAAVHRDDHLPKIQRALAHYASIYGTRSAGMPDFERTELPDADKLDGSLFLRVAGLTAKRMGRVRNGEKEGEFWDTDAVTDVNMEHAGQSARL
ncbi:hypothetical protein BDN72DRAFT_905098 [Pluteus cervinus]|uniref:Uncharacterized protein n=1 Tax=Pluteus cervinus TaxID=181527 RepID=A0ACD3A3J8_9AGAR|nr:hypothetical protein BDN72DRAFT_905098 [Pluteus cervinus]